MYQPKDQILKNYAKVLVNFALNHGQGIKAGQVVFVHLPESAKALLKPLYKTILTAKAHPIVQYSPDQMQRTFFDLADDNQINFFPATYLKGKIKQADHFLTIIAETDKHELEGVDPKRILDRHEAFKPYLDWRRSKEIAGKFSWTLGLFPTPAMAAEAGLTPRQCWQQVVRACFLDYQNPIKKWQQVNRQINHIKDQLNQLKIDRLHVRSRATDLWVKLGPDRSWLSGSGSNIPSFEIFISPDWRGTQGKIYFNQPLYRYGNLIDEVSLEFKQGRLVKATSKKGQPVLRQMIKTKNADKIGEFSLTDSRFSRITRFMAETLFDENRGGINGNVHIALGSAYRASYSGDPKKVSQKQWANLGFNYSVVHTDLVSTRNRTITAYLKNNTKKIIYQNGRFVI